MTSICIFFNNLNAFMKQFFFWDKSNPITLTCFIIPPNINYDEYDFMCFIKVLIVNMLFFLLIWYLVDFICCHAGFP